MERQFLPSPNLDQIETLLASNKLDELSELLLQYHPADIADALEHIQPEQAVRAFRLLPDFEASEVLDEANSLLTNVLVEKLDDERIGDLLDTLPMDDAVELLEDLPDETSDRLLQFMDPEERREVSKLLEYPEDTAGRLMNQEVTALRALWTVEQALEYLRALKETEQLHYLYVVDAVGRLTGVVPIRNIVLAQPKETIESITLPTVISVSAETDQEELADTFSRYDYTAFPVLDNSGKLIGVVTIDDAMDAREDEITEDIQQLGGSAPLETPYFSATVFTMVRKRVGWLILLFLASFLSSGVLRAFEELTLTYVILAAFIPLIIGTGGNAGSQTVATIIRAIAVGEIHLNDLGRAARREVTVGFVMGIILGLAGLGYALVLGAGIQVGLVIALTLPAVVVWSTLAATIIPIVAERFERIDATVVSAPMITTIVDATGLLIYFGLATLLLA